MNNINYVEDNNKSSYWKNTLRGFKVIKCNDDSVLITR